MDSSYFRLFGSVVLYKPKSDISDSLKNNFTIKQENNFNFRIRFLSKDSIDVKLINRDLIKDPPFFHFFLDIDLDSSGLYLNEDREGSVIVDIFYIK